VNSEGRRGMKMGIRIKPEIRDKGEAGEEKRHRLEVGDREVGEMIIFYADSDEVKIARKKLKIKMKVGDVFKIKVILKEELDKNIQKKVVEYILERVPIEPSKIFLMKVGEKGIIPLGKGSDIE